MAMGRHSRQRKNDCMRVTDAPSCGLLSEGGGDDDDDDERRKGCDIASTISDSMYQSPALA